MNALRHVTYRAKTEWMPPEDLVLTKTLGGRVRYVRENLVDDAGRPMTQPEFGKRSGLTGKSHHGVMHWEKDDNEPGPEARRKIAALAAGANYRPELFSLRGAEVLVVESAVPRLQQLEGELGLWKALLLEALGLLELQVNPEADPGSRVRRAAAPATRAGGQRR